jgi:hypothetical protein
MLAIKFRGKILTVLIAAIFTATAGWAQTSAAGETAAAPVSAPQDSQMTVIKDPSMHGMNAVEITYPAKWHFRGNLFLAGVTGPVGISKVADCGLGPTAVFRATSPDGLSFVEQWPLAVWGWSSGNTDAWYSGTKCYPLHGPMSAQEYLKYVAAMVGVEYLGDVPANAAESAKLQKLAQDANARDAAQKPGGKEPTTQWKMEMAEAMVGYVNGTLKMKGRLTVQLVQSEMTVPDGLDFDQKKKPETATVMDRCQARVVFVTAPEDQLAAVLSQWDRPGMGPRRLEEWEQARAMKAVADLEGKNDPSGFIRNEQLLSWRGDLARTQQVREKMYAQFDETFKLGLDEALAHSAEVANSRHKIPPDWTDFQLDDQFQSGREDGEARLSMVPNTWTDSAGTSAFETRDLDANPNGVLPGTWTSARAEVRVSEPQ